LSILLLDMDNFKAVNDSFGHNAGDIVLQALASIFTKQRYGCGFVGRWGRGGVFAVAAWGLWRAGGRACWLYSLVSCQSGFY